MAVRESSRKQKCRCSVRERSRIKRSVMANNTMRRTETEPKGTRCGVSREQLSRMTSEIDGAENGEKRRPPKGTTSRAGTRKRGDGKVDRMKTRGRGRKIHPKGDGNGNTINEMITCSSITVADTRFGTTRKPTKTPADKTTTLGA